MTKHTTYSSSPSCHTSPSVMSCHVTHHVSHELPTQACSPYPGVQQCSVCGYVKRKPNQKQRRYLEQLNQSKHNN
ncbi:hypothetical protein BO71DRAFT_80912 [Aspergillus ellipticus CBS 707.79]|uniref:Uncharacterized protein n=1 Tax=Aspergillus ellipticus CBS 707.79 TaxID=1448320 RepID=A0A319DQD8_9EURO|nr:hypothetical protein BO71DRAFT_80912 [Aspergillus ellipticus CBS 707.79]